jgi:DNA-binding response OmpR family regulator
MNQRILIVDDEELQRMTMKSRLQSAGYIVDTAAGGEEGLGMLKEAAYDIVLLDIRMPGMDGIETLNRVTREYPLTEVVMMTGFADFITAVECLKSGARDYLVKPIHPTELVTRLNTLIRERELRSSLDKLRKNFSTGMLYSILSPIYSMSSIIDHVTKGRSGPVSKEQTYLLTYARKLGEKTVEMIKNVTTTVEEGSRDFTLDNKPTDIIALIESVSLRYEILSRPKGLKIYKTFSKPLPLVPCDTEKMQQALNNILDYSLEHSLSGGTISISVQRKTEPESDDGDRVFITIKDSGIGIPGNGLSKIFGERVEDWSHITPDLKLTEIGLAVSKYLVEAHSGNIEVDFDAGSGNMFVISLPVMKPVSQTA